VVQLKITWFEPALLQLQSSHTHARARTCGWRCFIYISVLTCKNLWNWF